MTDIKENEPEGGTQPEDKGDLGESTEQGGQLGTRIRPEDTPDTTQPDEA